MLSRFPKLKSKKIEIIPGTAMTDFKPKKNILHSREKRRRVTTFISIGRFEPRKGQLQLIEAAKKVRKLGYNFKLIVCGSLTNQYAHTVLRKWKESNLRQTVSFVEEVDYPKKKKLLQAVDCFVISSQAWETFGLTMLEALSAGVIVVGTNVGSIPGVLSLIDKQLIADGSSSSAIAKKMIWF